MLMRFDPFKEFEQLWNTPTWSSRSASPAFPMDAYRRGERFYVHFDLPGVDPSTIDLTVEKNVLTVRAVRTWQPAEGDEMLVAERPRGEFSRQLFLGESLDASHLEASYDNGVLTVVIPVAEAAKPRKVEIHVGESTAKAINAA